MSNTDPTPDLLPPARPSGFIRAPALDKIRAWHAAALDQTSYPMIVCGALLAHLDALQAPAPDDGGEALGRGLYERGRSISMSGAQVIPWECLTDNMKSEHIENAIALDAAGYARGLAAGRSETTRHLIEQRNLAQRTAEDAHREIARLTAALSDAERLMGAAIDNGATDRARALTAEAALDTERSLTTELRAMEAEALASADRWKAASERHEQEAAEARAAVRDLEDRLIDYNASWSVMSSWLDCREGDDAQRPGERPGVHARRMVEAARLDGAREGHLLGFAEGTLDAQRVLLDAIESEQEARRIAREAFEQARDAARRTEAVLATVRAQALRAHKAGKADGAREAQRAILAIVKRAKEAPTTRDAWLIFAEIEGRAEGRQG